MTDDGEIFVPAQDAEEMQAVLLAAAIQGDEACRGQLPPAQPGRNRARSRALFSFVHCRVLKFLDELKIAKRSNRDKQRLMEHSFIFERYATSQSVRSGQTKLPRPKRFAPRWKEADMVIVSYLQVRMNDDTPAVGRRDVEVREVDPDGVERVGFPVAITQGAPQLERAFEVHARLREVAVETGGHAQDSLHDDGGKGTEG